MEHRQLTVELYRHFDAEGRLLYVGISNDSVRRWFNHKTNGISTWYHLSVRMEIERFPDRYTAAVAEKAAIIKEKPFYNKNLGCIPRIGQPEPKEAKIKPASSKKNTPALVNSPYLRAYIHTMNVAAEIYQKEHGHSFGAVSWLAKKLGVSRQLLSIWGKRDGIPERYVAKTASILGITEEEVRPEMITVCISAADWREICEICPDLAAEAFIIKPKKYYGMSILKDLD